MEKKKKRGQKETALKAILEKLDTEDPGIKTVKS